jgi:acyl-CoA synthetase (AMP-forming)/AMP-acid ligase II
MINTAGYKVFPAEVERVVAEHHPSPWSPSAASRTG